MRVGILSALSAGNCTIFKVYQLTGYFISRTRSQSNAFRAVTCDEMKDYTVKWIKWADNRAENMGKIKEIGDLQKRIRELEQDENWKQQNLRCCPHCERPIEKLEGCDLMKCGKDYHGTIHYPYRF